MKQAVLLHGTDGSSEDYFWFADTKQFLEEQGYVVWWPQLPHTEKPELQQNLDFLADNMPELNDESIIIGHSSACPLILSYLQMIDTSIRQAILVSGFYQSIDNEGFSALMLPKEEWDWVAIRHAAQEIILINSDNDPWGCDGTQARPIAEKLSAKFVLAEGQGHMGSTGFNQPYREHKIVKEVLEV